MEKWQKTVFLKQIKKADAKGWILDIMNCIDSLNKKDFTLEDMYAFEQNLSVIHPENKNIKVDFYPEKLQTSAFPRCKVLGDKVVHQVNQSSTQTHKRKRKKRNLVISHLVMTRKMSYRHFLLIQNEAFHHGLLQWL